MWVPLLHEAVATLERRAAQLDLRAEPQPYKVSWLAGWLAGGLGRAGDGWLEGRGRHLGAGQCGTAPQQATPCRQQPGWQRANDLMRAPASGLRGGTRRVALGPRCLLCGTAAPSAAPLRRHTRRPLLASRHPSNRRLPSPASTARPPAVCPPGSPRYPAPPRWPLPPPSLFSEPPAPAAGAGRLPHLPQQLPGSCGRHAGVRAPPGGGVP